MTHFILALVFLSKLFTSSRYSAPKFNYFYKFYIIIVLECLKGHSGQKFIFSVLFKKNLTDLKTNFTQFELSATFYFHDITD